MDRQQFIAHMQNRYGTAPDYPWAKLPDYAVFRHGDSGKWYALLIKIAASKLGAESDALVEAINIKVAPGVAGSLRQQPGVYPAWHMNKEHWVTLLLEGPMGDDELLGWVDDSYRLTWPGKKRTMPR
ncbi:MmcQ/YjbR family DNA-binding protein [Duffyella gerundensis]|uniref:MmcQ/YjbR family DNA-binding protein n=1 Tax=Duffyella TaxID=3026546 RepID=UPI003F6E0C8A